MRTRRFFGIVLKKTSLSQEPHRRFLAHLARLLVLVLMLAACSTTRAQYLGYVANSADGTVYVFAIVSNGPLFGPVSSHFQDHLIAIVPVGNTPVRIAPPSVNLNKAYVTNQGDNTLWVLDVSNISSGTINATNVNPQPANPLGLSSPGGIAIVHVPVGAGPNAGKVLAFIANQGQNTVSIVDTSNNSLFGTVSLGAAGAVNSNTIPEVAATADGTQVFVANNSTVNCSAPSAGSCPAVWMINAASVSSGASSGTQILTGTATATAASVTSNVATLTLSSNPITAGLDVGSTITVSGFSTADAYFDGTFTVSSVTSTQITYPLTHANGTASSAGSVSGGFAPTGIVSGVATLQAALSGATHTLLGIASTQASVVDLTGGDGASIPLSPNAVAATAIAGFCGPGPSPQTQPCADGSTLNVQVLDAQGGINWASGTAASLLVGTASETHTTFSTTAPARGSLAVTPDGLISYVAGGSGIGVFATATPALSGNPIVVLQNSTIGGTSFTLENTAVPQGNGATGLAISSLDPGSAPVSWFLPGFPSCNGTLIFGPIPVTCAIAALGESMTGVTGQGISTALDFGGSTACTVFGSSTVNNTPGPCNVPATADASVIGGTTTFPASGVFTVTVTGTSGPSSGTALQPVAVGANCILTVPPSATVGQPVQATLVCVAPNDILSATINWNDNSPAATETLTQTITTGNQTTFSFTPHAFPAPNAAGSVTATVQDTTEKTAASVLASPANVVVTAPSCTLALSPNPAQVGRTVTATVMCPVPAGDTDSFSAGITNWGDGATSATTAMTNTNGTQTASFTHVYAAVSNPSYQVIPAVSDSTLSVAASFPATLPTETVVATSAAACSFGVTPTKLGVGNAVTATLTCAAQTGDVISGTINWGDGTNPATTSSTSNANGTALLTFTHTYATLSSTGFVVSATAADTSVQPQFAITPTPASITVAVVGPPSCTLNAPTSGQTGVGISAALACTGPVGDALTATIDWGDGTPVSTGSATVSSAGTAAFSFTHSYATVSAPTFSIAGSVQDSSSGLSGVVTPGAVAITIILTPTVTPTPPANPIPAGETATVPVSFAGGPAEAGIAFTSVTCSVQAATGSQPVSAPACSVSPSTFTLDANGNATVQVSVITNGFGTASLIPVGGIGDRTPLFASLLVMPALALMFLGAGALGKQKGKPLALMASFLVALCLLTLVAGCGPTVQRSNLACTTCTTPASYTVTVTATSQNPVLKVTGVFTVTVS